jgi:hypothetical protein
MSRRFLFTVAMNLEFQNCDRILTSVAIPSFPRWLSSTEDIYRAIKWKAKDRPNIKPS